MLPVVEACTPHLFFIQTEPQRVNQVELAASTGTETGNVAGVWRYLGLIEDNVEWGAHVPEP
jgi:hypothetical protein